MHAIGSIGNGAKQLARLRSVLRPWQSLTSGSGPIRETLLPLDREDPTSHRSAGVPRGYLAVYAGNDLRRFVIPMSYLGMPEFRDLLAKAEEEYGFEHDGGITLPCEAEELEQLLAVMDRRQKVAAGKKAGRWSRAGGLRRCSSLIGTLMTAPSCLSYFHNKSSRY